MNQIRSALLNAIYNGTCTDEELQQAKENLTESNVLKDYSGNIFDVIIPRYEIESGDGYIKYSDGTMICYGVVTGTSTNSDFYNYLYRFAENIPATFSKAFTNVPKVTITPHYTSSVFAVPINSVTKEGFRFTPIKAGNIGTSYIIEYLAIGTWQ